MEKKQQEWSEASCGSHREVKNQDARFAKNDFSAIRQTRMQWSRTYLQTCRAKYLQ
jgi:hypothetical protein